MLATWAGRSLVLNVLIPACVCSRLRYRTSLLVYTVISSGMPVSSKLRQM